MRIDKLAMTSREALQTAMSTAADAQAGAVEPIHLLSALLGAGERNISVIIERIGADPAQLARSTQDAIDHAPKVSGEGQQMGLSNELVRVIEKAEKKATKMGDSFVVTEHLLMALAEDKGEVGRVLRDAGFTFPPLIESIPDGGRIDVSAERLPELDADFVFATWRGDTGGKPQDELAAMDAVMPGWCQFMNACRTGHYVLISREEAISNSYASLGLMAAQVQSQIAGRPLPEASR